MKKINLTIITAITALSLTVPALAAPTYASIMGSRQSNCFTTKLAGANCNLASKGDVLEYIKGAYGNGNMQKPVIDKDNLCTDNNNCNNNNCQNGSDCVNNNNGGCNTNGGNNNEGNTNGGNTNGGNTSGGNNNNGGNTSGGNNNNGGNTNGGGSTSKPDTSVSNYAKKVVELVNVERAKEGLASLSIDAKVTNAASVRAEEIKTSFSHTRPNGTSCFTALGEAGASYKGSGENIALGQKTPEEVVNAWMNSEGHRKNIMSSSFKYIGVAHSATAWVQMFTY